MKLYDGWMKAFEKRDFDEVMKYYHRDYSLCKAPNQYSYEFVRVVTPDEKYAREQQVGNDIIKMLL